MFDNRAFARIARQHSSGLFLSRSIQALICWLMLSLFSIPISVLNAMPGVESGYLNDPPVNVPILLTEATSTRAIALDSVTRLREPFAIHGSDPTSNADQQTRVVFFATGLDNLTPADISPISVTAVDGSLRTFQMPVEFIGPVPGFSWLSSVVVRLPNGVDDVGDIVVRLYLRGVASNGVRIGIGHLGGGPPDDNGLTPVTSQPANWTMQTIGVNSVAGNLTESGGVITLEGAYDPVLNVDANEVQFAYQSLNGDGQIVAKLSGLQSLDPTTSAGLMIRQSLTTDAANASVFISHDRQEGLRYGTGSDSPLSIVMGDYALPPSWLKLSRKGNNVSAFSSTDGMNWSLITTISLNLAINVYIGLAVSNTSYHEAPKAIFENVSITSGTNFQASPKIKENAPQGLAGPYIDSRYLTSVPFGTHSHWQQPWRAYLETVPAATFLNGIGVNFNITNENPDLMAQMLARNGIKHARIEIGWSDVSYDNEDQINPVNAASLQAKLLACKKGGIRPLILLNANQGAPCPLKVFNRTVTTSAAAGATSVQIDDTSGLIEARSGFSNLTDSWAAEAIITSINGNTVTLSKPLPHPLAAGSVIPLATLKYRPFSAPNTPEYNETIAGWQRYVGTTARFVAATLGTTQSLDKGFDMEIWNELTFGSNFLQINSYYQPIFSNYNSGGLWKDIEQNLVKATSDYVVAHESTFQGVTFADGMPNTMPWAASSAEPARIGALDKHPYHGRSNYPADEQNNMAINALFQNDVSGFKPVYSILFPEYAGTALQTEHIIRDMSPITNDIYGLNHGRNARLLNNQIAPCPVWITETGIAPDEDGITNRNQALALKAKTTARYLSFYLNKGATQLDFYAAVGGDTKLGLVQDNFIDFAKSNSTYPSDDSIYTSPSLSVINQITAKMRDRLDANLTNTRSLQVLSITDTHSHYQFAGDGSAAHPALFDREVFTFLPFQINAKRFVIPYYVMTRDVTKSFTPEDFTVQMSGVKATGISISVYDPINNKSVPVTIKSQTADTLTLTLTATDYPYLLILQES